MLAKEKRGGTFLLISNARPMPLLRPTFIVSILFTSAVLAADFKKDIQPILERNCYECHSEKTGKKKGGFVFDDLKTFKMDIADNDVAQIRPGKPSESHFLEVMVNDGKNHMPPKDQLSTGDIKKITEWISEGASFDKDAPKLAPTAVKKSLPPIMSWTNMDGKTIKAGFVRLEGENVVLKLPANGKEASVALSRLSAASQKLARDCAAP
jgi:mono/diheme cytochrome c family protein